MPRQKQTCQSSRGAITQADFEKNAKEHQSKAVLVYCTVGYRSGIYAKKLRKKSWNYQGSILDWCKNQLPVVTQDGNHTTRVPSVHIPVCSAIFLTKPR